MIVMPSNNSNAHKLESLYPNRIGMLIGPGGWRNPKKLPFAIDNGRFASWSKGKKWNEKQYLLFLDKAVSHRPIWAVVPDAVGDAEKTFEMWMQWKFQISHRGIVCALAVQDGMTPDAVRKRCTPNPPEVIFVGGTTTWKRRTAWNWCREFPHVHIGRINTERWLWFAHRCGAESVDGTGFFRGDENQLKGLHRYLRRSQKKLDHKEVEVEYSRTFFQDWEHESNREK